MKLFPTHLEYYNRTSSFNKMNDDVCESKQFVKENAE